MRARKCPTTKAAVGPEIPGVEVLNLRADLRVTDLADIAVAPILSSCPAQEQVACRLHQPMAGDDAQSVVGAQAGAGIWLKH